MIRWGYVTCLQFPARNLSGEVRPFTVHIQIVIKLLKVKWPDPVAEEMRLQARVVIHDL